MTEALHAYRALTPQQRAVLRDRKLAGTFQPTELIALLRPLASLDVLLTRLRTQAIIAAVIVGLSSIGVLIFIPLGLLVTIPATAGLTVVAFRLKRADLSDQLRTVTIPFLMLLREDTAAPGVAEVQLDLAGPIESSKKTGERPRDAHGSYTKIVDHLYVDPWFSGQAELADGAHLKWSIRDQVVMQRRQKRSASGKTKLKTKYKRRSRLRVELKWSDKAYTVDRAAAVRGDDVQVQHREGRALVKVRGVVRGDSLEPMDVKPLVDLVALAYLRARPVGQGAS